MKNSEIIGIFAYVFVAIPVLILTLLRILINNDDLVEMARNGDTITTLVLLLTEPFRALFEFFDFVGKSPLVLALLFIPIAIILMINYKINKNMRYIDDALEIMVATNTDVDTNTNTEDVEILVLDVVDDISSNRFLVNMETDDILNTLDKIQPRFPEELIDAEFILPINESIDLVTLQATKYKYKLLAVEFTDEFEKIRRKDYSIVQIVSVKPCDESTEGFLRNYYREKYTVELDNFEYLFAIKIKTEDWSIISDFPSSLIKNCLFKKNETVVNPDEHYSYCEGCKQKLTSNRSFYCDTCYNYSKMVIKKENSQNNQNKGNN